MKIYGVVTKSSTASTTYCHGYRFALGPYESITFENSSNTVKFPFYSPAAAPSILNDDTWTRVTTAGSTNFTPAMLYSNVISLTQVFNYISFGISTPTGGLGDNIGVSTPSNITNVAAGIEANYDRFGTATNYEDVITFSEL